MVNSEFCTLLIISLAQRQIFICISSINNVIVLCELYTDIYPLYLEMFM